ncbi:MAG: YidC/Oxa1 family insertase periplasmic-domain containing protein [Planctomycetaceae bacterium]
MERRHIQFIVVSLAIVLAGQVLQAWLFPPRPVEPVADTATPEAGASVAVARDPAAAETGTEPGAVEAAATDAAPPAEAPRRRLTLGSLDPAGPAKMLVTLTSRGAAVERIELAEPKFHDQDDRSGYLGHLAPAVVPEGCRLGVVGPGTPADRAGLRAGDVVVRLADAPTADPEALHGILARTRPGQEVAIDYLRDGAAASCRATLGRRPLEVVRPEFRGAPVVDPDRDPHDPLSFRLSIEARDGRTRKSAASELSGHELADVDWEVDPTAGPGRVRFTRPLARGLTVVKEYGLPEAAGDGPATGDHALELAVELTSADGDAAVTYALDGPTGLPTEGWWYAQRVGKEMWSGLAVRDVALRFAGAPTALISGLKIASGSLDRSATAVLDTVPLSFAGVDSLYFASALLPAAGSPDAPALAEVRPLAVGDVPEPKRQRLIDVTPRLVSRPLDLEAATPVVQRFGIFAGPKRPALLARFGLPTARMDDLVYYGWFGWVARPMIFILHAIHAVIGNYGIAILLLTVTVRGLMFPISRKQAAASQKMQLLQPEMKAIADRYKDDPEKRTRATQELWRKHNYNPMGGCLLVFFQIPIFMGLYRSLATDVELRQAPLFSEAIRWCSNLAAPDMFWDWSKVLPSFLTAPEGWLGPFLNLFPLATIGLFLWQQKLFMPPAVDEQQKMQQQVMNYMMWFMALMFFKVPCGLCLYFIASSLWGIGERLLLPQPAAAAGAGGRVVDAAAAPAARPTVAAGATRQKRAARKKQR